MVTNETIWCQHFCGSIFGNFIFQSKKVTIIKVKKFLKFACQVLKHISHTEELGLEPPKAD